MTTDTHPKEDQDDLEAIDAGEITVAIEAAKQDPGKSLETGIGTAWQGIFLNFVLGAAKLAAGVLGHSYALVADAAESFSDVLGSLVTVYGLNISAQPADRDHPMGHGRAETIAAGLTASALCFVGAWILWTSIESLQVPRTSPSPYSLVVLVPVIALKEWMFHRMRSRGVRTGSMAVIADAWHQRSDAITSLAALTGIVTAWIGGPSFSHADSWAAVLASVWLILTGLWLLGPTVHEVMEGSPDPSLVTYIERAACKCAGVRSVGHVWVRKLGMRLMVDLNITVDRNIPVHQGHAIAHLVKDRLEAALPQVRNVMVHIEPSDQ
jgi:cation diffusion facilitator family transporter